MSIFMYSSTIHENFDGGLGTFGTTLSTYNSGTYSGWYEVHQHLNGTGPQSGDVTGGNFVWIETSSSMEDLIH